MKENKTELGRRGRWKKLGKKEARKKTVPKERIIQQKKESGNNR